MARQERTVMTRPGDGKRQTEDEEFFPAEVLYFP